jgi:hypothetical protein
MSKKSINISNILLLILLIIIGIGISLGIARAKGLLADASLGRAQHDTLSSHLQLGDLLLEAKNVELRDLLDREELLNSTAANSLLPDLTNKASLNLLQV